MTQVGELTQVSFSYIFVNSHQENPDFSRLHLLINSRLILALHSPDFP